MMVTAHGVAHLRRDTADYTLIAADTTCRAANRLEDGLPIGSVEGCYHRCLAQEGCLAFSVDVVAAWCSLCDSASANSHMAHSPGTSGNTTDAYRLMEGLPPASTASRVRCHLRHAMTRCATPRHAQNIPPPLQIAGREQ